MCLQTHNIWYYLNHGFASDFTWLQVYTGQADGMPEIDTDHTQLTDPMTFSESNIALPCLKFH